MVSDVFDIFNGGWKRRVGWKGEDKGLDVGRRREEWGEDGEVFGCDQDGYG